MHACQAPVACAESAKATTLAIKPFAVGPPAAIGIISATGRETRTRARSYPRLRLLHCMHAREPPRASARPPRVHARARLQPKRRRPVGRRPAGTGNAGRRASLSSRRQPRAGPLMRRPLCVPPSTTSGRCRLVVAASGDVCVRTSSMGVLTPHCSVS